MKTKTKIHFVCHANRYRSRLAEAYAKSLGRDDIEFSSSGAAAISTATMPGYAIESAERNGVASYLGTQCRRLSPEMINDNDIIIFMRRSIFDEAQAKHGFDDKKCLVWDVKDNVDWPSAKAFKRQQQKTYKLIERNINKLLKDIDTGGWVDIVDQYNRPLNLKLPLNMVNQKGLWHRGCHAVISLPNNKVLVQKRSANIIFSPKLIDITMGGHVDAGEQPKTALLREIKEEIGITADTKTIRLLNVHKAPSYHPRYKRHSNAFVYTYHVPLNQEKPQMSLEKSEVSAMKAISPRQLKRLLKTKRLKRLGRLNYTHAYYQQMVADAGLL